MNYVYAVKIKTDMTLSANSDIGLYAVTGEPSEFRWSELPLQGTALAWASGILDNIDAIRKSSNPVNGGCVCTADGLKISFFNNNQLSLYIESVGLSFNGLKCEIYEFVGTDLDADSYEVYKMYEGICEGLTWSQLTGEFNVKSARHKRRANLATFIDSKNIIPVTFGSSNPANDRYFKAVRTTSNVNTLKVEDLAVAGLAGTNFYPPKMNLFPVYQMVGTSPSLVYQVRVGYMDTTALPDGAAFVGKYVLIKEGKGQGLYRRITTATVAGSGQAIIELTFADYFPEDLTGNWEGTHATQTWLHFVNTEREYELDSTMCGGFFDANGNQLTNAAELYSKSNESDDGVIHIPPYGYDVDTGNANNNSLIIDPKLFADTPDKMLSFFIMPANVASYSESDLSMWANSEEPAWTNYNKLVDGLFYDTTGGTPTVVDSPTLENPTNITDKKIDTYARYRFTLATVGSDIRVCEVFKITVPSMQEMRNIVNVRIGLNVLFQSNSLAQNITIYVKNRGYINRVKHIESVLVKDYSSVLIDNLPDFYWIPNESTKNKSFYVENKKILVGEQNVLTGRNMFSFDISTMAGYESLEEVVFMIRYTEYGMAGGFTAETRIHQMAVMIELEGDIKEVIYV